MIEGRQRQCWLRLRRHQWVRGIDRGWHRWKICSECGAMRITHHVSCPASCWAGPG